MPDPFISVQDLIDHIGRGGTADPGMLQATDAACDICRDISGQDFNQVVGGTVILDGTGTDALLLPQLPVSKAGTVLVNGTAITDYVLDDDGLLIRRSPFASGISSYQSQQQTVVWPEGRQNIQVTYDHGYADADLPRSVRMVALSIATRLVVQGPAKQESIGGVNVSYAANSTDLTSGERMILLSYKRPRS